MAHTPSEVRAAGVVLLRKTGKRIEVAVVHRPRRKDWSLPKGKLDRGEHVAAAARRETLEETGEDVTLGIPLMTQHYRVDGRPKSVRYWVGRLREGGPGFTRNKEIDELEWLSPDRAARRLSYPRDAQMMRAAVNSEDTSPLIILRHAKATRRVDWDGEDSQRPLAPEGKRYAKKLTALLEAFGIVDLYSSDSARCTETLKPFASSKKASISLEHLFSEEGFESKKSLKRLDRLLQDSTPLVLCTHRPVLPDVVEHVVRKQGIQEDQHLDPKLVPGGFIVLHRTFDKKRGMRIVAIERHNP